MNNDLDLLDLWIMNAKRHFEEPDEFKFEYEGSSFCIKRNGHLFDLTAWRKCGDVKIYATKDLSFAFELIRMTIIRQQTLDKKAADCRPSFKS